MAGPEQVSRDTALHAPVGEWLDQAAVEADTLLGLGKEWKKFCQLRGSLLQRIEKDGQFQNRSKAKERLESATFRKGPKGLCLSVVIPFRENRDSPVRVEFSVKEAVQVMEQMLQWQGDLSEWGRFGNVASSLLRAALLGSSLSSDCQAMVVEGVSGAESAIGKLKKSTSKDIGESPQVIPIITIESSSPHNPQVAFGVSYSSSDAPQQYILYDISYLGDLLQAVEEKRFSYRDALDMCLLSQKITLAQYRYLQGKEASVGKIDRLEQVIYFLVREKLEYLKGVSDGISFTKFNDALVEAQVVVARTIIPEPLISTDDQRLQPSDTKYFQESPQLSLFQIALFYADYSARSAMYENLEIDETGPQITWLLTSLTAQAREIQESLIAFRDSPVLARYETILFSIHTKGSQALLEVFSSGTFDWLSALSDKDSKFKSDLKREIFTAAHQVCIEEEEKPSPLQSQIIKFLFDEDWNDRIALFFDGEVQTLIRVFLYTFWNRVASTTVVNEQIIPKFFLQDEKSRKFYQSFYSYSLAAILTVLYYVRADEIPEATKKELLQLYRRRGDAQMLAEYNSQLDNRGTPVTGYRVGAVDGFEGFSHFLSMTMFAMAMEYARSDPRRVAGIKVFESFPQTGDSLNRDVVLLLHETSNRSQEEISDILKRFCKKYQTLNENHFARGIMAIGILYIALAGNVSFTQLDIDVHDWYKDFHEAIEKKEKPGELLLSKFMGQRESVDAILDPIITDIEVARQVKMDLERQAAYLNVQLTG